MLYQLETADISQDSNGYLLYQKVISILKYLRYINIKLI